MRAHNPRTKMKARQKRKGYKRQRHEGTQAHEQVKYLGT